MWMATKYGFFDVARDHRDPSRVAIRSGQKDHLIVYQKRCYGSVKVEPAPIRNWLRGWWISIPKVDWLRHIELFAQDGANEANLISTVNARRPGDARYQRLLKSISHAVVGEADLHGDSPSAPIDLETGEPATVL